MEQSVDAPPLKNVQVDFVYILPIILYDRCRIYLFIYFYLFFFFFFFFAVKSDKLTKLKKWRKPLALKLLSK